VNLAANSNHWIGVSLQGSKSNRDGIGARVTVSAGGRAWVQEERSGSSYISNSDLRLHFGLGTVSAVQFIDVVWPSGLYERFAGGASDRFFNLVEGKGVTQKAP